MVCMQATGCAARQETKPHNVESNFIKIVFYDIVSDVLEFIAINYIAGSAKYY